MKYLFGSFLLILHTTVIVIIMGGGGRAIIEFMDAPSLTPILFAIAIVIYMTGEYKTFTKSINAIISKKYKISQVDLEKAVNLYKLLVKVVVYASILTFLLGLVLMLGNMYDLSLWNHMIAVAVIPLVYGAVINLVFFLPAIHILNYRENSEATKVISEKLVVDKLLELCYKKGISPEEILEAEDISFNSKK